MRESPDMECGGLAQLESGVDLAVIALWLGR